MPDPRQLTDEEATQRRRRWLQERHARTRELVVVLLRQAPEAEVVRALDQLPGGELARSTGAVGEQRQADGGFAHRG